jgi:hypothetical protein
MVEAEDCLPDITGDRAGEVENEDEGVEFNPMFPRDGDRTREGEPGGATVRLPIEGERGRGERGDTTVKLPSEGDLARVGERGDNVAKFPREGDRVLGDLARGDNNNELVFTAVADSSSISFTMSCTFSAVRFREVGDIEREGESDCGFKGGMESFGRRL